MIAPTAKYPVVLGFRWLADHDPLISCSQRLMTFQPPHALHWWDTPWGPSPAGEMNLAALTQEELSLTPSQYHDLLWLFEA